ncbi:DnaA regulatory inactivator Hda [Aestuariibacter salexigens]|uniref:DnaA regulatory inactivator Hda n=1 Tax=Aestuariibacter salexigens TaxID=226010 RepID=UPI0004021514|nr:DnaA regulatory inactivator Hda [Aestuariibacter salexigens]
MSSMQLTLPVAMREQHTFANFVSAENAQLIAFLQSDRLLDAQQPPIVYISGETGSGKTHCLSALCQHADSHQLSACYLDAEQLLSLDVAVCEGLEHHRIVCVDNVHALAAHKEWQIALFDLINRVIELNQGVIVITGDAGPSSLALELADLKSRLSWGMVHRLVPLNDEQRLDVLCQRAAARSIPMPEQVAHYLVTRWRRDLPSLISILDTLDRLSLQQKRRLTIPFVKQVIDDLDECE